MFEREDPEVQGAPGGSLKPAVVYELADKSEEAEGVCEGVLPVAEANVRRDA